MSKKENLKRILLCVFMIIGALTLISWMAAPVEVKHDFTIADSILIKDTSIAYSNCYTILYKPDTVDSIKIITVESKKASVKETLISEVNRYIKSKAPMANIMLAETLVENALKHNIDLCFMMCQTQVETNFGTTGMGRANSKKSMFGVINRNYSTYDAAIKDYIDILKKNYLRSNRTELDLLRRYTTVSGYRYASNPNYESSLSGAYKNIKATTNIYKLQQQYREI